MSRAGGVAALGAAMLLGALAFGATSLYLPAMALLVVAVWTALWITLAASGAHVERTVAATTVEEEAPWPLRLEVRSGIVRPPGGELVEPLLGRAILLPRARRDVRVEVRFARRGRRTIEPARFVIRDPLGLAERVVRSPPAEVLVLPRVEPVIAPRGGRMGLAPSLARAPLDAAELEPEALRPYHPGAPATRIHWPAVARTGEVFERSLVSEAGSRPLVVLDTRDGRDGPMLDRAVRAAASLCVHLARDGGCSVLLPGDRRAVDLDPDMRAWHAIHVRLALVEAGGAPSAGRLERAGAIYWVTPGTAVPAGLVRAAARERWLVAPAAGDEPAVSSAGGHGAAVSSAADAAFAVAGCVGQAITRRRAARRAA